MSHCPVLATHSHRPQSSSPHTLNAVSRLQHSASPTHFDIYTKELLGAIRIIIIIIIIKPCSQSVNIQYYNNCIENIFKIKNDNDT